MRKTTKNVSYRLRKIKAGECFGHEEILLDYNNTDDFKDEY